MASLACPSGACCCHKLDTDLRIPQGSGHLPPETSCISHSAQPPKLSLNPDCTSTLRQAWLHDQFWSRCPCLRKGGDFQTSGQAEGSGVSGASGVLRKGRERIFLPLEPPHLPAEDPRGWHGERAGGLALSLHCWLSVVCHRAWTGLVGSAAMGWGAGSQHEGVCRPVCAWRSVCTQI